MLKLGIKLLSAFKLWLKINLNYSLLKDKNQTCQESWYFRQGITAKGRDNYEDETIVLKKLID